jgi:hypothetical protein
MLYICHLLPGTVPLVRNGTRKEEEAGGGVGDIGDLAEEDSSGYCP